MIQKLTWNAVSRIGIVCVTILPSDMFISGVTPYTSLWWVGISTVVMIPSWLIMIVRILWVPFLTLYTSSCSRMCSLVIPTRIVQACILASIPTSVNLRTVFPTCIRARRITPNTTIVTGRISAKVVIPGWLIVFMRILTGPSLTLFSTHGFWFITSITSAIIA